MSFYDQVGWQETDNNVYADAERFEDLRPVSSEYIHRCHLRLGQHLPEAGQYLLDVASGPVQYPEYLTYSRNFIHRICADVSFVALKRAKTKVGEKGIYIQCDITSLPLKEGSVDSFVSLHTIYHVPESEQLTAFQELHRVLRTPGRGVIVYTWGSASPLMKLIMPWLPVTAAAKKMLKAGLPPFLIEILRTRGKRSPEKKHAPSTTAEPKSYFHPHGYAWYRKEIANRYDFEIACWRSVSVPFLRAYVHERLFGRGFLSVLFGLENVFPRFFGKYGQFPMIVCNKKEM
jgi:ubiquinone/menaquinone biosynthesis C-methylase UbiE